MKASAHIKETPRIGRIGQLLAQGLMLSSCVPSFPEVAQPVSKTRETDPVLALFENHSELGISEVMSMADIKRTTAHRRLRELVKTGVLIARGRARATRYRLLDPPKTQKA